MMHKKPQFIHFHISGKYNVVFLLSVLCLSNFLSLQYINSVIRGRR